MGIEAVGAGGYTAMQMATILGEHVKLVPDIAVSGDGAGGGLADALIARMLSAGVSVNGAGASKS